MHTNLNMKQTKTKQNKNEKVNDYNKNNKQRIP